ncbi:MAG: hypothetical protein AAGF11_33890 [Myxococcota bacterium]
MGIEAGARCLVGLLSLSLGACAAVDDQSSDDFDTEFRNAGSDGLSITTRPGRPGGGAGQGDGDGGGGGGGWIANGLHNVNVSGVNTNYGLSTPEGMAEDGDLLALEDLRGTAEYLVECALPEGQSVTKVVGDEVLVFDGLLGLAPQWQDGACDEDCQQWVSACLLARTNTAGHEVDIWISADHPSIGTGVSSDFPFYEATFYGNLFADGNSQYQCRGTSLGVFVAFMNGRTCSGPGAQGCGITSFGRCGAEDRCVVDYQWPWSFHVDCAAGSPPTGDRYHSISTFVGLPED